MCSVVFEFDTETPVGEGVCELLALLSGSLSTLLSSYHLTAW